MNEDARDPTPGSGASPSSQRWAARQKELRAALAADREHLLKARTERKDQTEHGYHNPAAFYLGLLALLLLFAAAWFVFDAMRCDPFYASVSKLASHACR